MSIIDFHTHPWSTPAQCLCFYPGAVPNSPEDMRLQLEHAGITHICGSALQSGVPFDMAQLNNSARQLEETFRGFYTPGFHVHPDHVEESAALVQAMGKSGHRLIGELVPYMHGWNQFSARPCVEELNAIWDAASPYPMVFSFHTIWDWPLDDVIAAHPGISFVAAHPGERQSVAQHIERMRRFDNVYLDLSGTGIFRFGCIRHLVNSVGSERILFGTDYPICNPAMYVHAVLGENLGSTCEQRIFHDNAARLLGL